MDLGARDRQGRRDKGMSDAGPRQMPEARNSRYSKESIRVKVRWKERVRLPTLLPPNYAMQETWVQSLAWEDPLEKGMSTHSSILAWKIPWAEEPRELQ